VSGIEVGVLAGTVEDGVGVESGCVSTGDTGEMGN
jgi:hypothetical protein